MLTSCFCFKAAAAEIDIYETEPNGAMAVADVTEDEADNFGTISSATDSDWYKTTFDRGGKTNFWLGNIPSGCDYQMQIYKGSTLVKTVNNNSTGTSEFAQYNTLADTVYYIKISSNSGYNASSYYLFSMRRNNLGEARMFTYRYYHPRDDGSIRDYNTRPSAEVSMPLLWKTGYSGQEYLNNKASPVFNSLSLCNIMVINNHGEKGHILCDTVLGGQAIYAKTGTGIGTNDRSFSTFSNGQLSDLKLLIFTGCKNGLTETAYGHGNLVNEAYNKGVDAVIAWNSDVNTDDCNVWLGKFFEFCSQGYTVLQALDAANNCKKNDTESLYSHPETIKDQRVITMTSSTSIN